MTSNDQDERYFALATQWANTLAADDPHRFSIVVTRPNSPESRTFLDAFARTNIKVGDRIRFDTHSNLGVSEDVVREKFIQTTLLEPYARNTEAPALVLTEHSWCFEADVVEVL
jgi:hypothetical protein